MQEVLAAEEFRGILRETRVSSLCRMYFSLMAEPPTRRGAVEVMQKNGVCCAGLRDGQGRQAQDKGACNAGREGNRHIRAAVRFLRLSARIQEETHRFAIEYQQDRLDAKKMKKVCPG